MALLGESSAVVGRKQRFVLGAYGFAGAGLPVVKTFGKEQGLTVPAYHIS
jgi:hypothetical protein